MVDHPAFRRFEKIDQIFDAAVTEPEGGYEGDRTGNDQFHNEKAGTSPWFRPGNKLIPDEYNQKREQELIDESECEFFKFFYSFVCKKS